MLKLGPLELGTLPRIAVPFDDGNANRVVEAKELGLDIAELRVDRLRSSDPGEVLAVARRLAVLPTIATIRTRLEGGEWTGDEEERLDLFMRLIPHVDGVDVERSAGGLVARVREASAAAGKLLIVSHHDFASTPDPRTLDGLIDQARAAGADIVKVATLVRHHEDVRSLARLCLEHPETPLVVVGMGPRGLLTRLALPALGSLITFGFLGAPTAPGQLPLEELRALMRRLYPDLGALPAAPPEAGPAADPSIAPSPDPGSSPSGNPEAG